MKKVADIRPSGAAKLTVYYDEKADINPYRVYIEGYKLTEHGAMKTKRLVEKYADFLSCIIAAEGYIGQHNGEHYRGE